MSAQHTFGEIRWWLGATVLLLVTLADVELIAQTDLADAAAITAAGITDTAPAAAQAGPKSIFPVPMVTIPIVGETQVFQGKFGGKLATGRLEVVATGFFCLHFKLCRLDFVCDKSFDVLLMEAFNAYFGLPRRTILLGQ